MTVIKKIADYCSTISARIAMFSITILLFMTVGDVLGRYLFNRPIPGTFEITKILFAISVFFSFSVSQINGENLGITLFYDKFPRLIRGILDLIISLVSIAMFSVAFTQMLKYAARMLKSHTITSVLRIPIYPWIYIASLGLVFLVVTLLWDLAVSLKEFKGDESHES